MNTIDQLTSPSELERTLFSAGLVEKVSLAEIYDIKAGTSTQRASLDPKIYSSKPDIHNPEDWANELWANARWEWFAYVLRDCRTVLDIGCGEGRPSLYLSRRLPKVVGLDISPAHIALAKNTAKHLGLGKASFEVGDIEHLPFADSSFDGVCFGGNVFTYQFDVPQMLREIQRVLRPGGIFAFEQWPVDPNAAAHEGILWFIDGGPPIIHYHAGQGLYDRSYFIYIRSDLPQGKQVAELATRMSGLLSDEQQQVCEKILTEIREGNIDIVERVIYSGENRSIAATELPELLTNAGFGEIAYWAVPDGRAFAEHLRQSGKLDQLTQEELLPYLRALVASSPHINCWVEQVTCRRSS